MTLSTRRSTISLVILPTLLVAIGLAGLSGRSRAATDPKAKADSKPNGDSKPKADSRSNADSKSKADPKLSAAIEALNQQFAAALQRGDAAALAALYSDAGQVLPPGGEILTGREALTKFWREAIDSGMKSAALETVELTSAGDFAFEVGRFRLYGADGKMIDAGKDLVVWRRERAGWRLYRDIWNSSQSPAAP